MTSAFIAPELIQSAAGTIVSMQGSVRQSRTIASPVRPSISSTLPSALVDSEPARWKNISFVGAANTEPSGLRIDTSLARIIAPPAPSEISPASCTPSGICWTVLACDAVSNVVNLPSAVSTAACVASVEPGPVGHPPGRVTRTVAGGHVVGSGHQPELELGQSVQVALHEQEGYEGCYVLLSEEGKVLVLTFWESNEAARASRLSGFYQQQIEKLSDLVVDQAVKAEKKRFPTVAVDAGSMHVLIGVIWAFAKRPELVITEAQLVLDDYGNHRMTRAAGHLVMSVGLAQAELPRLSREELKKGIAQMGVPSKQTRHALAIAAGVLWLASRLP